MNYQDKDLTCQDCNQVFTLSAGEQEFFASKGFKEPKRCKVCRRKKTAEMLQKNPQIDKLSQ